MSFNDFRETGSIFNFSPVIFTSKTGHDSNPGTLNEPIRTPFAGTTFFTGPGVIGAGYYLCPSFGPAIAPYALIGDGKVILDFQNGNLSSFAHTAAWILVI
jgi:hypothetical protein